jgi:quercetin dioxygenase-like cupin family protein
MSPGQEISAAPIEPLWFLGTLARIKLDGEQTEGRLALIEVVAPRGASPPVHSHVQDETFYLLDGEVTFWVLDQDDLAAPAAGDPPAWVARRARTGRPGAVVFAAGGTPHTFRVESDSASMLVLSTPAGIEQYARALGEPAQWPWLPPPADGPRVSAERMGTVERELGIVTHAPPPPRA